MDENENAPLPDPTPYQLDQAQAMATIIHDMRRGMSLANALRAAYQSGYMFLLQKNMRDLQADVAESIEEAQAQS